ncbi:N-6 DNA methylase [Nocardiopsis sp. NPDC006198]|uniref:N-6 DNA methylase n=1 Tax=Nocardiopsis sp. NPDC006198 TaxID=3154472 RepID=UPI0033B5336F
MTDESKLRGLIKGASDRMRSDDNTKGYLSYLEQLTWLLFLKQYDALEDDREAVAMIDGTRYERVIADDYRWSAWANSDLTGGPLISFVSNKLLPHLKQLSGSRRAERVAALFQAVTVVMKSGYTLREVIDKVDQIDFHALTDAHTMSVVYESLLAQATDAGWSGEFYTPRPIVDAMVAIVQPKLGQTVYDPCAGSCGFLVSAHEVLREQARTTAETELLRSGTFFAQESGALAHFVGTVNLLLHGIDDPQAVRRNTLEQDIRSIAPDEQRDLIFTNPPFGGEENSQVQQNFPARSDATELLFLQHCMAKLAMGGTCAIVVPDGILFRTDQAFLSVRRRLLNEFSVEGIIRLPSGVFINAPGARTNLLIFRRTGKPTTSVRFYLVRPPKGKPGFSKTLPLTRDRLALAIAWVRDGEPSAHSWTASYDEIVANGYDLNVRPRLEAEGGHVADPLDLVDHLRSQVGVVIETAGRWKQALDQLQSFRVGDRVKLGNFIEERGERAGVNPVDNLVGVTNSGGFGEFKGAASADRSRYRRIEVGDFVYNPMRVNVGSLAYCRTTIEEGWVSPEYVVFRLKDNAPFSPDYLLFYLTSQAGLDEINRNVRGGVRARLYYANLSNLEVPVPAEAAQWDEFLETMAVLRGVTTKAAGTAAASDLAATLFSGS